ncbi:hypothetical protein [Alienimonas sp. DA493]|uniref:hypothetical protein n=1 Tax=Alienimonas sp. DA493 TaxID=3373605 RepID=UPI0037550CF0
MAPRCRRRTFLTACLQLAFAMSITYSPPPRQSAGGPVYPSRNQEPGPLTRCRLQREALNPLRPKLAVRALPRGAREAALALVEYSLPGPDRRLPDRAAEFLKALAADDLRVLYAEGADANAPAAGSHVGSHVGFTVLAELPGSTPEELTALLTEQARDLLGDDPETV